MRARNVVIALVALVAAGWAVVTGFGDSEAAEQPAKETTEAVAMVETRDMDVRAEAPGQIEPIRVVEVKSKASGEILALHAETGDDVEHGALLAEIDPRDVRNDLAQAEADVDVARVRARTAIAQQERMKALLESEVVTEQEYEAAMLEAANARATLVRAETNLELARERMGDVSIRAPITGTVIERGIEVGQIIASAMSNVSGGTTLLRMADLSEVQVRTLVDETDIGRIAPGQRTTVEVEAYPGRSFVGEVLKVEPQAVVEQNVTMFPVLIRLDNPEGLLKPGMNAEVQIQIARRAQAVTVPNAAVVGIRDAESTAEAIGLDPEAVREALSEQQRSAGGADAADGLSEECRALMETVREEGPNAMRDNRDAFTKCRPEFEKLRQQRQAGSEDPNAPRPGVVFVIGEQGTPEPRRVMLGVSDWEHTEIVDGLEAGEKVLLVSVARLQFEQQQMTDRIRERAGGPFRGS